MPSSPSSHPVSRLLDLLGRRWALRILWELRDGELSYGTLRERCDEVSTSVLATRLRELGDAGIVERTDGGWRLTTAGTELGREMLALSRWAERNAAS